VADRSLRESGGPAGGTTGGYIDSFENMPGAQNQPFGATPPKAFVPAVGRAVEVSWPDENPVAGVVCAVLPGPLPEAPVVVRLDHELDATSGSGRSVTGSWLVLEPSGDTHRWQPTGAARGELWAHAPSAEPWLDDEPGMFVGDAPLAAHHEDGIDGSMAGSNS
jgi:hypothetical protein